MSYSYISSSMEKRKFLPFRLFIFPYTLNFSNKFSEFFFCMKTTFSSSIACGELCFLLLSVNFIFKYLFCLQNDWLNTVHIYIIDRTIDRLVAECWLYETSYQTCRNKWGIFMKMSALIYLYKYRHIQLAICKHKYIIRLIIRIPFLINLASPDKCGRNKSFKS